MKTAAPATPEHTPAEAVRRPTGEALDRILRGPLARPAMRLWKDLDALVQDGSLRGVELDPQHPDIPCFLLDVAPDAPRFYVEMFLDEPFFDELFEADGEDAGAIPLNVLMNWLGSDTKPAFWQTGFSPADAVSPEPDFREILAHILAVAEARLTLQCQKA